MILLISLISRLPLSVLYLLADVLYLLAWYVLGYRKKVVFTNLKNAFPEKNQQEIQQIARQFYRHLADVIVEIIKLYSISREEMSRRCKVIGYEHLLECNRRGSATVVMAAHHGNWEWLGSAPLLFVKADVAYQPLTNKTFDKIMLHIRSRMGDVHLIPVKNVYREVYKRLPLARNIGLLADQSTRNTEYWTLFLNQETGFMPGGEQLAKRFGLPVFYHYMRRIRRGYYEIHFEPLCQPPYSKDGHEIMEAYVSRAEEQIKNSPAEWLWSHKRWKHKRPADMPLYRSRQPIH